MDDDEVFDLLDGIDSQRRPDKAEAFEELALSMPVGEHGRASFLVAAGEHRQMRKEYAEARRLFELALADGGESEADPQAFLVSLALDTGDEPAVEALTRQLRVLVRGDRVTPASCLHVGEAFEDHDRLREAMRWFTLPLTWGDLDGDQLDTLCLAGRWRVRRRLGLPEDRLDQIAAASMAPYSGADGLD